VQEKADETALRASIADLRRKVDPRNLIFFQNLASKITTQILD